MILFISFLKDFAELHNRHLKMFKVLLLSSSTDAKNGQRNSTSYIVFCCLHRILLLLDFVKLLEISSELDTGQLGVRMVPGFPCEIASDRLSFRLLRVAYYFYWYSSTNNEK